ncbi:MAG: MFS transporter, partial [Candidatus Tectomicrobia bacterium]|nr:MFS transporter [Candidatus Tectomicrobia bacterium]
LLGGFITDHFAWNWIFFLNIPVGLLVLAIIPAFPKIRSEVEDRRLNYSGMMTLVLAAASTMIGLSWAKDSAAPAAGLVAFGLAMAVVFVFIQSKSDYPIMPLETYRNPTVAVSLAVVFLSGFGLYGSLFFIPLFFQVTLDMSASASGSVLAPIVVGLVTGSVLSGQIIARTGGRYRPQAIAGTMILSVGMCLLSTMNRDTSLMRGLVYVFVAGVGTGVTLSTCRLAVQNSVPYRLVGAATSAVQFCRLLSGTVGLTVLGVVMSRSLSARIDATLPASIRAALPPGRLDALKSDPRVLVDQEAADALMAALESKTGDGAGMAHSLFDALDTAFTGAVGDVFAISAGLAVISIVAAVFLRAPRHAEAGTHGPEEEGHRAA